MITAEHTLQRECEIMDSLAPVYRVRRDVQGPAYQRCRDEFSQWVLDDLRQKHKSLEQLVILDAGCGTGEMSERLLAGGCRDVLAVDVAEGMLTQCRKEVPGALALRADLASPPIRPQSIDAIIAAFTAHHLHDPGEFFKAAEQLLKPGGSLYLLEYNVDCLGFSGASRVFMRLLTAPTRLLCMAKNRLPPEPIVTGNPSHRPRSVGEFIGYAGRNWECDVASSQLLLPWHNECLLAEQKTDRWLINAITRLDAVITRRLKGSFVFMHFCRSV